MLREAPGVKMIVTSQRRLSYQEVQTLELSGLPYPKEVDPDWQKYPAVELFLDRVKRSQADYHVTDVDIPHLIKICQFVDGLPLGLELAGAGLRFCSCEEIARELAQNLDLLATTMKDIPVRHRSLRAAFNHSWKILPELEKDAFRRLSIYQGEFSLDDAMATTGASIGVISRLVDRSLIQKNSSGYYLIQPVLRQYVVEKLEDLYTPESMEEDLNYFSSEDLSITRDPLTKLPNRVLFRDLFKQALAIGRRRSKYVALMIVEIENIHTLKRDLDHEKLNPHIKQAGEVLVKTVRDSDIIATLALGKFAIILESISEPQDGAVVAQKIRTGFDKAYIVLPDGSKANVHIGISVYPEDGEDISELLNNANMAMNKTKLESINYHYNAYDKPAFLSIDK
jgi:diguanylate cyclase (GGDEF)-like protein